MRTWILALCASLTLACATKGGEPAAGPAPDAPTPPVGLVAEEAEWASSEGGEGLLTVTLTVTNHLPHSIDLDVLHLAWAAEAGACEGWTSVRERVLGGRTTTVTVTLPCAEDRIQEAMELMGVAIYQTREQKRSAHASPIVKVSH